MKALPFSRTWALEAGDTVDVAGASVIRVHALDRVTVEATLDGTEFQVARTVDGALAAGTGFITLHGPYSRIRVSSPCILALA